MLEPRGLGLIVAIVICAMIWASLALAIIWFLSLSPVEKTRLIGALALIAGSVVLFKGLLAFDHALERYAAKRKS